MNNEILKLEPSKVWYYFQEILNIPRPSKKEGKIIDYLMRFGKEHGLETLKDEVGNVLIRKPATPGMENRKTVVLQSHIDMVCEKNSDVDHDFENDPIEAYIEDGWVTAKALRWAATTALAWRPNWPCSLRTTSNTVPSNACSLWTKKPGLPALLACSRDS